MGLRGPAPKWAGATERHTLRTRGNSIQQVADKIANGDKSIAVQMLVDRFAEVPPDVSTLMAQVESGNYVRDQLEREITVLSVQLKHAIKEAANLRRSVVVSYRSEQSPIVRKRLLSAIDQTRRQNRQAKNGLDILDRLMASIVQAEQELTA